MSTRPGGPTKSGPKHQNRVAFHHNPHSTKSLRIDSLPNEGLCEKCHAIIEWRKKFHKFKPLSAPRTCQSCHQKTVVHAYHVLCVTCARAKQCCAKCCEPRPVVKEAQTPQEVKEEQALMEARLAEMSLREKRSFYRKMDRGEDVSAILHQTDAPPKTTDGDEDDDEDDGDDDDDEEDEDED